MKALSGDCFPSLLITWGYFTELSCSCHRRVTGPCQDEHKSRSGTCTQDQQKLRPINASPTGPSTAPTGNAGRQKFWQRLLPAKHYISPPAQRWPRSRLSLTEGWSLKQHQGLDDTFAPEYAHVGMDIYDFGHFTLPSGAEGEQLRQKLLEYYALKILKVYRVTPLPSPQTDMQMTMIGQYPALYWKPDTSYPGLQQGHRWRQWCLFANGHVFLILSSANEANWPRISKDVDTMVASFSAQ